MKNRVKLDVTILLIVVLGASLILCLQPKFFPQGIYEKMFDFLGIIVLTQGVFLRMAARGHKTSFSASSNELVTSGPYAFTRNPMYLGSFLIGCGYILILWPWWAIFIFAAFFYFRFNRQMESEEIWLKGKFAGVYDDYCRNVPRIFPSPLKWLRARAREVFNIKEAFSTKEKNGLWGWPLLAFCLDYIQEIFIYGKAVFLLNFEIFVAGMLLFAVVFTARFYLR
ncbi:MAG: isoprenylcysteine carboxylmethyltransferase family protein [Candidatus Omnitrophica bacterium]|nr:isoprenylcysteine carboxylmethyltransferase family protein [Candidatus Omnitrophota bacterium]